MRNGLLLFSNAEWVLSLQLHYIVSTRIKWRNSEAFIEPRSLYYSISEALFFSFSTTKTTFLNFIANHFLNAKRRRFYKIIQIAEAICFSTEEGRFNIYRNLHFQFNSCQLISNCRCFIWIFITNLTLCKLWYMFTLLLASLFFPPIEFDFLLKKKLYSHLSLSKKGGGGVESSWSTQIQRKFNS